tara:strand:+ start:517 stop:1116 length:600 start_codon:yes stop_codon:yes gene_type:complete
MFNTDAKVISELSKSSPKYTLATLIFTNGTIRTKLYRMMTDMTEVKKKGSKATCLNNTSKNRAYKYIQKNYRYLHSVIHSDYMTTAEKMADLMEIPNIGPAKAGFILQMCIGEVGCIDCHNRNMFNIDVKDITLSKPAKLATKLKVSQNYIKLCEELGGTEFLWDNWCEFIAGEYPTKFKDAQDVSKLHVDAIVSVAGK